MSDTLSASERLIDEKWMDLAIALAQRAEAAGDVPVGCVVVNEGGVVSEGHNTREACADPTGHAEIAALRLSGIIASAVTGAALMWFGLTVLTGH